MNVVVGLSNESQVLSRYNGTGTGCLAFYPVSGPEWSLLQLFRRICQPHSDFVPLNHNSFARLRRQNLAAAILRSGDLQSGWVGGWISRNTYTGSCVLLPTRHVKSYESTFYSISEFHLVELYLREFCHRIVSQNSSRILSRTIARQSTMTALLAKLRKMLTLTLAPMPPTRPLDEHPGWAPENDACAFWDLSTLITWCSYTSHVMLVY